MKLAWNLFKFILICGLVYNMWTGFWEPDFYKVFLNGILATHLSTTF